MIYKDLGLAVKQCNQYVLVVFQLFYEYHAILCLVIPAFKNPVLIVGAVAVVLVQRCRFLEALGSASYYQGKNEAWLDNGRFFGDIHVTQFFGKMHFRESRVETENLMVTRRTSFFKGVIQVPCFFSGFFRRKPFPKFQQ